MPKQNSLPRIDISSAEKLILASIRTVVGILRKAEEDDLTVILRFTRPHDGHQTFDQQLKGLVGNEAHAEMACA